MVEENDKLKMFERIIVLLIVACPLLPESVGAHGFVLKTRTQIVRDQSV
jgi:hypothetical protein